ACHPGPRRPAGPAPGGPPGGVSARPPPLVCPPRPPPPPPPPRPPLPRGAPRAGSWGSAGALFAYAAAFSFAYLRLTAATGALILFALVQATMIGVSIARGDRPGMIEWLR